MNQDQRETFTGGAMLTVGVIVALVLIFGVLIGGIAVYKKFSIWSKEQTGRAALAEAIFSKQVKVEEARARKESAKLDAEAEFIRAEGAAKSISTEASTITPDYVRYLWVRQQDNLNDKTVVYIPTEGGLPILEANRLQGAQQ